MVVHPGYPWTSKHQFTFKTHLPANSFLELSSTPNGSDSLSATRPRVSYVFIGYRLAMLVVALFVWITAIYKSPDFAGIYLTIWSLTLVMLHFLYQAGVLALRLGKSRGNLSLSSEDVRLVESSSADIQNTSASIQLPWPETFGWLLASVASHASLLVTLMFWTALFPNLSEDDKSTPAWTQVTSLYLPHIMNFVLMFIDGLVAKVPFRGHHFVYTLVYLLVYGAFYVSYWAADGTAKDGGPVYVIMDFGKDAGLAAGIFVGVALTSPLLGLFWHAISFLRERHITRKV